jgi:3-deoxy-7-phosphoheptulonate synthase
MLDPAHSSGKRSIIPSLARAAVAVGADGLMVEVHPRPEAAWSDGAQSLTFGEFDKLMRSLQPYVAIWKESRLAIAAASR